MSWVRFLLRSLERIANTRQCRRRWIDTPFVTEDTERFFFIVSDSSLFLSEEWRRPEGRAKIVERFAIEFPICNERTGRYQRSVEAPCCDNRCFMTRRVSLGSALNSSRDNISLSGRSYVCFLNIYLNMILLKMMMGKWSNEMNNNIGCNMITK